MKSTLRLPALLLSAGILLIVLASQSPPGFGEGVQLFKQGQYIEAYQIFRTKDLALGDRAPASLLFNRALTALRLQKPKDAEISAERAAARGGPEGFALRDFILGNAAFERAERAAAEAKLPEGGPRALQRALLYLHRAIPHWQSSLHRHPRWPEAKHNITLAKKRIQELEERAKRSTPKPNKAKTPKKQRGTPTLPKPLPRQAPPPQTQLPPAQVQALLQTLARNEKAKWSLRRQKRGQRPPSSGRSW